ncbi:MAG TPA: LamG domain-containing protein, partial [Chthoniobacterales bacterium]
MKTLTSWFRVNRALGPTILAIVGLSTLLALATSTKQTTTQTNSASTTVSVAPACTARAIFSASFTQGQDASPAVQQQWRDFIQSLIPASYDTVTISGSNDTTGRTLTDATIVPQIAAAMQNGTPGTWTAGGFTWNVGIGCQHGNDVELNANASGDTNTCDCPNPGYVVRPDISPGNANWGGVNTATCFGPSQTMTVTFSGPGAPSCDPPPSGMVSWWPAEGDANDIQDNNDGTIQGTVTFARGKVGQAFSFDGNTANYVFVPHNTNLDLTQFTVDAWVFPTPSNPTDGGFGTVVDKEFSSGGINYSLFVSHDGTVEVDFNNGSHQFVDSPPGAAPQNTWTHITGTYDGPSSKTLKLYVNGVLIGTHIADAGFETPATGQNLYIGVRNAASPQGSFQGLIDEVEVFDHALTGAEVLAIYNAGCTGKCRSCASAPGSMVSWWKGEGNTTDSEDSNNGIFNGTPAYGPGEVGQGFSLNGTDQYIEVPDSPNLSITGPITIDAWIKANNNTSEHAIVEKYDGGGSNGYFFRLSATGHLVAGICNASTFSTVSGATQVTTGTFHHVAAVFDGSNLQVYLDGVLDGTAPSVAPTDGTNPLEIGARGGSPGNFFNGVIDEVEIFDRALTQREVQRIYDAGSAGKCPCITPPSNMIAWWPGDDNAKDIQGGHDATLNDATFGPGEVSDAFKFDGTDDSVSIPASSDWNFGTGDFTFDFWALGNGTNRMHALSFEPDPTFASRNLDFDFNDPSGSGSGLFVFWNGGGNNFIQAGTVGQYTEGNWHHYALTRSGSTLTLYIDGAVAGTALNYTDPINLSGGSNNYIGASTGQVTSSRFFWNGLVDELEIFSSALSAGQVAALYNAGGAGKCKPQATPTPTPSPTPTPTPT